MSIAIDLLRAPHIGVRELKEHLSRFLKKDKPLVITDRGRPVDVILPYSDMLNLIDIVDEITDAETASVILEGKKAVRDGVAGVPVLKLFTAIRGKHK